MFNFSVFKSIITIVLVLVSLFIVTNNFINKDQSGLKIKLGLDLQGGSYIALEANTLDFNAKLYSLTAQTIATEFKNNNVAYTSYIINKNTIIFNLENTASYNVIKNIIRTIDPLLDVSVNNNTAAIELTTDYSNKQLRAIMANSVEVIRRRIDEIGTNEPSIKIQGNNQIIVELPGIENPERVKKLIGTTAQMNLHIVDYDATFSGGRLKPGYRFLQAVDSNTAYAVKMEPSIYGTDLTNAKLEIQNQEPVVFFSFNTNGGKQFAKLTTENQGGLIAIVLDNKVLSAPRVTTAITSGSGIISGSFTILEAQDLALLLRAGGLPTPLTIVEERTVGPTLGLQSIKTGIYAGIVGYILVFIFMFIFYKKLGIVANIALIINTVLILACLSIINATLTLPGIAGIILTIGMAIDANILVYERFASELKYHASSQVVAMNRSFNRVFTTILDSNLTTLFTALFLFTFGAGPIKGLAITLIVGILCSMFSIMFITKFIIKNFVIKKQKIL